jgi:hypothetical protein
MREVLLGGVEVFPDRGSVRVAEALMERATCDFVLVDHDDELAIVKGQPVEVRFDGELLFAGVTEAPEATYWAPGRGRVHRVSVMDWHYLADRRVLARGFVDTPVHTIVETIVADFLAADGVELGVVDPGPVVRVAQYNYVPVTRALDQLAEQAGYWWRIDPHKRLHFRERGALPAPWSIAPDVDGSIPDVDAGSDRVDERNPGYRNRQFIRGGRDVTDPQTERFRGDADTRSFTVGFPIAKEPTITVGGVAQTVGVRGLDDEADRDWYWSFASNTITQNRDRTPPGSGVVVEVVYQGLFDVVIVNADREQIEAQQAIEGFGTGVVDDVAEEPELNDRMAAFDTAAAKLTKWATRARRLTFTTDRPGLHPGQLLEVTIPRHRLNGDELLVESVEVNVGEDDLEHTITAATGPVQGSWTRFFVELAEQPRVLVFRENISEEQILVRLFQFSRTWQAADRPNMHLQPLADGSWLADGSVTPAFRFDDRIRYVQWHVAGQPAERKLLTQRAGLDGDVVESVAFIAPAEANGQLLELSWWGGFRATAAVGSGVEVGRVTVDEEKNAAEAWQVERTDTKGF